MSHIGHRIEATTGELRGAANSLPEAGVRGERAVEPVGDAVLYGRLAEDFSKWTRFSPGNVWVEPLDRADGIHFGYQMPATQQDVDIAKVTSPEFDFSGVGEMLAHPSDLMNSYTRGPLPSPWSTQPGIIRTHGVLDGQGMLLNVDLGDGAGRSLVVVDGSTAARIAESRGMLGAGASGSELFIDSCQSGVVGGAAESFVSQLRKSGSFSGKVFAPTDISAHVELAGESSARVAVVSNYNERGEMLPLFRDFDVPKQVAAEQ